MEWDLFCFYILFHFSYGADTSQHEKDVQESAEGQQGENMYHESSDIESVGNESLSENEDISSDYEYWNIPRQIEESLASEEECTPVPFASESRQAISRFLKL